MRVPLIAGNMKMYKTQGEAVQLAEGLKKEVAGVKDRDVVICPTFISLSKMSEALKGSNIKLGAQNLFWEKEGAFTGEVSAKMVVDAGCSYVIIGHSERRQYFGETDETVNKKIKAALAEKLIPIVCVGETLSEREGNNAFAVIERQIRSGLSNIPAQIVIAYEPVWAIGTGKTATPEMAQEVHAFIRKILTELYGKNSADQIRILYGGSVKPENISALMKMQDIDGALVGGACLKADSFGSIVKYK